MATPSSQSFSSIAGGITDLSAASTLPDHSTPNPVPEATPQAEPSNPVPEEEEEPAPPAKRPVGRPKGSKNKTIHPPVDSTPTTEKRPVGRPRGTGKKKEEPESPPVKRPVGRPRKDGLPPGSGSSSRTTATYHTLVPPATSDYYRIAQTAPINQWVPFTGSISAPAAPPPVPAPVIDPALQNNEWADLANTKPEEFLQVLLAALDAPNSPSLTGPSVEEAFKSHLGSLAPPPSSSTPNSANGAPTQTIPSLYSILKTFWLPSSPSYFALTASATSARTPSSHRFLYWDPQPLVFNGIACPTCAAPLANRGRIRSGPLTVHDLAGPFFVIGCAYVCPNNHLYASTDAAVRRALPAALEREFPARLLAGDTGVGPDVWNWQARGVSRSLWHLVLGALRAGLGREVILQLVRDVQHGVPEAAAREEDAPERAAGTVPMEEEESAEEAAAAAGAAEGQGQGQGDAVMTPTDGTEQIPMVVSATQAFNDAWTANSVITSMDTRNNPVAYARFAVPMFPPAVPAPGIIPYDPRKRPFPFGEQDVGSSAGVGAGHEAVPNGTGEAPVKKARNPRHCVKCGSQACKGKGGRHFCTNACMDCGKFDCHGRNSRRPDKRCDSGWPEGQPQVQVQDTHVQQVDGV